MTFWQLVESDFSHLDTPGALTALAQVVMIDILLAADNAVAVAALASGLEPDARRRVMFFGIGVALLMRVLLSLAATVLLRIPGVTLIGGGLLLWVAWRMAQDLFGRDDEAGRVRAIESVGFVRSVISIALADFSMSLDNALGVAAAARAHPGVLVIGLVLSVLLMGAMASLLASVMQRHGWLGWVGLALILYVAGAMILGGVRPLMGTTRA